LVERWGSVACDLSHLAVVSLYQHNADVPINDAIGTTPQRNHGGPSWGMLEVVWESSLLRAVIDGYLVIKHISVHYKVIILNNSARSAVQETVTDPVSSVEPGIWLQVRAT